MFVKLLIQKNKKYIFLYFKYKNLEKDIYTNMLKDNENKILKRELNSLQKINDNYEKTILAMDKIPMSNEEGIIVRNVLSWLIDK